MQIYNMHHIYVLSMIILKMASARPVQSNNYSTGMGWIQAYQRQANMDSDFISQLGFDIAMGQLVLYCIQMNQDNI